MKKSVCMIGVFLIVLSLFNQLAAHDKGDQVVIGHYQKLHSKVLKEKRTLLISVPKGYELSQEKYPVLFVLDGDVSVFSEAFFILRNLGFGSFPDGESALMLVAARLRHIAGTRWGTRRYMNMQRLKDLEKEVLAG